jgi:SEC-C motif
MTRRNEPCPCGSGKRFKRCHGVLDGPNGLLARQQAALRALELHRANERIREAQQGEGRPIVAVEVGDHPFVAVGLSL